MFPAPQDGVLRGVFDAIDTPLLLLKDEQILAVNSACVRWHGEQIAALIDQPVATCLLPMPGEPNLNNWLGQFDPPPINAVFVTTSGQHLRVRASQHQVEGHDDYRLLTLWPDDQPNPDDLVIGIYRADASGRLMYANHALARLLGARSADALIGLGQTAFEPSPGIFGQHEQKTHTRRQEVRSTEVQVRCLDGRVTWLRDTGRSVVDHDGKVSYYEGTMVDISDDIGRMQQFEERQRRLEIINNSLQAIAQTSDLNTLLESLLTQLAQLVPYVSASIWLMRNGSTRFVIGRGLPDDFDPKPIEKESGRKRFERSLIEEKRPLILADVRDEPEWVRTGPTDFIRSWMGIPLVYQDQVIGLLNLDHDQAGFYTEQHSQMAFDLVLQVSIVIANLQYFRRAQDELAERERAQFVLMDNLIKTDALYQISRSLIEHNELDVTLPEVLNILALALDAETVLLLTYDESTGAEQHRHIHGSDPPEALDAIYALLVEDNKEARLHWPHGVQRRLPDGRDIIAAAINWWGIIGIIRPEAAPPFAPEDRELLITVASQLTIAIQNTMLYDQLRRSNTWLGHLADKRFQQLKLAQTRLQIILDATGEGIFYIEDFVFQYVNPAFCRMVDYNADELIGQPLTLVRVDSEDSSTGTQALFGLTYNDTSVADEPSITYLRRKDDTTFLARLTFTLIGGPGSRPLRMVAVVRDVSHEHALQEQRMRFINNAAHELRTPLSSFNLRLHMMRRQPERLEYHLDRLEHVNQYINELVEEMLDLTRYERGDAQLAYNQVILDHLIREAVAKVEGYAARVEVALEVSIEAENVEATLDAERIRMLCTKLLTHAVNVSPRGSTATITLTTDAHSSAPYAQISVIDAGAPLDEADLEMLFEPFSRPGLGEQQDTGLGLALARAITHLHQGHLVADSNSDGANRITAILPLNIPTGSAPPPNPVDTEASPD